MDNTKVSPRSNVKIASRVRVQRYRATHRRIDYAPSADALAVIERQLANGLDNCFAGVIDRLIVAGDKAIAEGEQR
jgi:hypothetical protein